MAKDALPKATRFEAAAPVNGTWDGTDEADATGLPVPTGMVAMVVAFPPAAAEVPAAGATVAGAVAALLAPAGVAAGAVPTTRAGAGVVAAAPEAVAAGVEKATWGTVITVERTEEVEDDGMTTPELTPVDWVQGTTSVV